MWSPILLSLGLPDNRDVWKPEGAKGTVSEGKLDFISPALSRLSTIWLQVRVAGAGQWQFHGDVTTHGKIGWSQPDHIIAEYGLILKFRCEFSTYRNFGKPDSSSTHILPNVETVVPRARNVQLPASLLVLLRNGYLIFGLHRLASARNVFVMWSSHELLLHWQ